MLDSKPYLFCITIKNDIGFIHIVPKNYWDDHRVKYPDYIPDDALIESIEELGYMEVMQNTFEFNTRKTSQKKVKSDFQECGNFEYSKDFEKYMKKEINKPIVYSKEHDNEDEDY